MLAFTYFGFKTLYDAFQLEDGDQSGIEEEREEAAKEVDGVNSSHDLNSLYV